MGPIRVRKVVRDLLSNKPRTFLAVLSIAIGVFALGVTLRSRAFLTRTILDSYRATNPASIKLTTSPVDHAFVDALGKMPGVGSAEGQRRFRTHIKLGAEWRPLILTAVADFALMDVNRVSTAGGIWPPPDGALVLERSYIHVVETRLGADMVVKTAGNGQRQLPLVGLAHDLAATPGQLSSSTVFGYVTLNTLRQLGAPPHFNELLIVVDGDRRDLQHVQRVAAQVRKRLEQESHTVITSFLLPPDKPEIYNTTQAVLLTLAAMGTLSIALSAFLIVNVVSGMLARQVPHIGILKAIGARRRDLMAMYLGSVLIIAVLATLIAAPLSGAGAWFLARGLGELINYDVLDVAVPVHIVGLEILVGLAVPLVAALYPILAGTRITVQQAISSYSVTQVAGRGLAAPLRRMPGVPMTIRYALRNMFRRRLRMCLTLAALSLSGAIMIAVVSVYASLFATLDQLAEYWRQDIRITFQQPYRPARIASAVLNVPGVTALGYQSSKRGTRERPDGTQPTRTTAIFGIAPASPFLAPKLIQGRWLTEDDTGAAVVNLNFLDEERDVELGDTITLDVEGRKTSWRVVGVVAYEILPVVPPLLNQPNVYINHPAFASAIGELGRVNEALIVTERSDPQFQKEVRDALDARLAAGSLNAELVTHMEFRQQIISVYRTVIVLLCVMALLFTVVGGLGLMSAMSLNVLERTKELGVLRAIGASNSTVMHIVIAEGVCVGVMSWFLAALLALPLSQTLSRTIGMILQKWPLEYSFPPAGLLAWLLVVLLVAVVASYLPARNAARLSVREVLAFE